MRIAYKILFCKPEGMRKLEYLGANGWIIQVMQ
jgi:hypothetical protein